jgi:hypothetical protein
MMADTTYNGWTNYETWAIALWIDNDRASYDYWRDIAIAYWQQAADPRRKRHRLRRPTVGRSRRRQLDRGCEGSIKRSGPFDVVVDAGNSYTKPIGGDKDE